MKHELEISIYYLHCSNFLKKHSMIPQTVHWPVPGNSLYGHFMSVQCD